LNESHKKKNKHDNRLNVSFELHHEEQRGQQ